LNSAGPLSSHAAPSLSDRPHSDATQPVSEEFVYLAVVLDAYSRLVIGWALERSLEARLAIGALQMALKKRGFAEVLIHHSDLGVQYACGDYPQLLKDHTLRISMSRKGNP
jgi:transposase InsO family protein